MTLSSYFILLVHRDGETLSRISSELLHQFGDHFSVELCNTASAAVDRLKVMGRLGRKVGLVVIEDELPSEGPADLVKDVLAMPDYFSIPVVVISKSSGEEFRSRLKGINRPFAAVSKPVDPKELIKVCKKLLTDFFAMRQTPDLVKVAEVLDVQRLSEDFMEVEKDRDDIRGKLVDFQSGLLRSPDKTDRQLTEQLTNSIGKLMDLERIRRSYSEDDRIISEGERNSYLHVVVEGRVRLTKKVDDEKLELGIYGPGKFVGLLSFVEGKKVFSTVTAATDCVLLRLGTRDLRRLLSSESNLSGLLFNKITRSLSQRIRMHVELQLKVRELNQRISRERDDLKEALQNLELARAKLVESEKMAVLGQFVAGIAHELNNPAGALQRGGSQLADIIMRLLNDCVSLREGQIKDLHSFGDTVLRCALRENPHTLREIRKRTRSIEESSPYLRKHHELARMLAELHVDEQILGDYVKRFGENEKAINILHRFHLLGQGLKHIQVGTERIEKIIGSLRSFARPATGEGVSFRVRTGIDDTLVILGHHFKMIRVEREYEDVPKVIGDPGEMNQVWTNLIVNACEAMSDSGLLRVRTEQVNGEVAVSFINNGPRIPPEHLESIWDVNFTTKKSAQKFGLGLGLSICKDIVERNGGRMEVASDDEETRFTVYLKAHTSEEGE